MGKEECDRNLRLMQMRREGLRERCLVTIRSFANDVNAISRDVLAKRGFEKYFVASLFHPAGYPGIRMHVFWFFVPLLQDTT